MICYIHSGTYKHSVMASRPVSVLSPHKSWDDASGRSQELADLSPSRHEFDPYRLTLLRSGRTGLAGFDNLTTGQRGDSHLDLDEVSRAIMYWQYIVTHSLIMRTTLREILKLVTKFF